MAKERKFSPEVEAEIADKYSKGLSQGKLCDEYDTCRPVVKRILTEYDVKRPEAPKPDSRSITEFTKRAKSTLWRQDPGKERKTYDSWITRVNELQSVDGAGYTHAQSVVQASKDYPCLLRLFREYDLSTFDPNPLSHPQPRRNGQSQSVSCDVICEGVKQSYRESLRWAIDAAGAFLRAGIQPAICPCDTAWYLYEQARAEPKDFLAKVGQIESKGSSESEDEKNARKSGKRTIAELDSMLSELESEDEGHDNTL